MKTLIIEFLDRGHYPEYLMHILHQINIDGTHSNYYFFLSPMLKTQLQEFEGTLIYNSISFCNDQIIKEYNSLNTNKQIAEFIYFQILQLKKTVSFDHVLFLNLNLVLRNFSFLNPFNKIPFQFSGVFFQSPYRLRKSKRWSYTLIRREGILRVLTLNKNCTKIYLLNDKAGANFYKKWSEKITFLPDPVKIVEDSNLKIHEYHNLSPKHSLFLHIGAIGEHKGSKELLLEIEKTDNYIKNKVHFLFIGKMNIEIENEIIRINESNNEPLISYRNEFVSKSDFSAYINQSHVILISNKNVESSSGIVNHCLANNKVVITPNLGYYKEQLEGYGGAVLYDQELNISAAILTAYDNFSNLSKEAKRFNSKKFIEDNSIKEFTNKLLNNEK